jgi:hypothetical protein
MKKAKLFKMTIVAAATTLVIGCSSVYESDAPQVSSDGLDLKKATRSTTAYMKSGVDFSEYNKVHILPSQVAFKKNWKRDYNRDQSTVGTRVSDKDVLRIKNSVAVLLDEIFKEEFSRNGDSPLVEELSEGTLVIKPAIINLDVNAPDVRSASRMVTYTQEAGEATLFLELYDGVSGEILARVMDAEVAGDRGYHQWANRVTNKADAKRMIRKWAKALRVKFDEAQHQ